MRNDDERLRWKLSLDVAAKLYGLDRAADVDVLQLMGRAVYNSHVSTEQMLGPQPEDRPS